MLISVSIYHILGSVYRNNKRARMIEVLVYCIAVQGVVKRDMIRPKYLWASPPNSEYTHRH